MRIAYLVNQYPAISHTFIRREIEALTRRGIDVTRYAIRPSASPLISDEDIAENEVTTHIVLTPKMTLIKNILQGFFSNPVRALGGFGHAIKLGWTSEAGLLRHILYYLEALVLSVWTRRDQITHLHAHFGTNAATIAMLCAQINDISFSFTVHGPEEFEKIALISLPDKIRRSSFTVAISNYGASQMKMMSKPDVWHKIKIVRCGLEADFFKTPEQLESRPSQNSQAGNAVTRFLCVGRLCAQKAQIDLVRAAAALKKQNQPFKLTLIGDGDMRGAIEETIAAHQMEDQIELAGWKTPAQVREALEECDIFVLPSYGEGLPVSIMEALAMERPVISTYIAGIPELISSGECGWLVPAGNVDAITNAMSEAINTPPNTRTKMGQVGHDRTALMHHIDLEAEKLASHFQDHHDSATARSPKPIEGS